MAKAKKRDDGRYAVSLSLPSGKRKYFYSTVSRHEAEVKKADWMKAHPDGEEGEKIDHRITVEAWSAKWLEAYKSGLEDSTKRWYRNTLRRVCSFQFSDGRTLGSMRVADVRAAHCAQFVNSLTGNSKSDISRKRMVLRQIFTSAKENGIITADPTERLPKVKGTYEGHKSLTRREAGIITANYQGHQFGLPVMLMLWAGLRKGECFALRWKDIDLARGVIHVSVAIDTVTGAQKATKTENSVRDIPILAPLQKPLQRAYMERSGDGLVFPRKDGTPYRIEWIDYNTARFKDYIEERVGERIEFTCHDLRDTFATMCYDAGVDVKSTQQWMGHSDVNTTLKIYTKLSSERKAESVERMNSFVTEAL